MQPITFHHIHHLVHLLANQHRCFNTFSQSALIFESPKSVKMEWVYLAPNEFLIQPMNVRERLCNPVQRICLLIEPTHIFSARLKRLSAYFRIVSNQRARLPPCPLACRLRIQPISTLKSIIQPISVRVWNPSNQITCLLPSQNEAFHFEIEVAVTDRQIQTRQSTGNFRIFAYESKSDTD